MIGHFPTSSSDSGTYSIGGDIGAGDGVAIPYLYVAVSAKGTNSGTITISLQAAPDSGTVAYTEGSYTTLFATSDLTANNLVVGDYLIVPVPPTHFAFPSEALPRFYRIYYDITGTVDLTFKSGLMLNPPSSLLMGQYSNNFAVG